MIELPDFVPRRVHHDGPLADVVLAARAPLALMSVAVIAAIATAMIQVARSDCEFGACAPQSAESVLVDLDRA